MGQSQTFTRSPSLPLRSSRKRTQTSFPYALPPTTKFAPPDNIFVPIQQDNILGQIPIHVKHPLPRTGIADSDDKTIQTNKFYANAFLNHQDQPIWTQPYFMWWGKGGSNSNQFATWGMNVGHAESGDLEYGDSEPPRYYAAPRKQSIILSAVELDVRTFMTTDSHLPHSVNINLSNGLTASSSRLTFPVVQGMSFITAGYQNATPAIQTAGKGFETIGDPVLVGRSAKYRLKDCDGRDWLIYITPAIGTTYDGTSMKRVDANTIHFPSQFKGTVQVAKAPPGSDAEILYDKACGTFVVETKVFAIVNDTKGQYSFNYAKIGTGSLLMFLLPHHIQSLDAELKPYIMKLQLQTPTKGIATAVWANNDTLSFTETNLPTTMGFAPWAPTMTIARTRYPQDFVLFLTSVAELDLRRAMSEPIPTDSYYYAGKSLSRFATLMWVIKEILNHSEWLAQGLDKLKQEMARYIKNTSKYPLYYDNTWKGLVSKAGLEGDPGADFGNTYYNDHHFHFGYFIYTAAVIAYLDPSWLAQGDNKRVINLMVKDIAESEYEGRDFPFQRCFDWYAGHSWAKGLFESADGKDEESTSEDGFASYAIKMWGKVTGDVNMEKRGNLMLAVQARSFNNYFYLASSNSNQPPRFVPHKVSGITFENKVDYATYFGNAPYLIHGIHMLPLGPPSAYLRSRAFVREEWDAFFNASIQTSPGAMSTAPATPSPKASPPICPFHHSSTTVLHASLVPVAHRTRVPKTAAAATLTPTLPDCPSPTCAGTAPPTRPPLVKGTPLQELEPERSPLVPGGWRGVLFANLALVDAKAAYAFFRDGVEGVWDERWVDVGTSRSWCLVWCAGLGGVR